MSRLNFDEWMEKILAEEELKKKFKVESKEVDSYGRKIAKRYREATQGLISFGKK